MHSITHQKQRQNKMKMLKVNSLKRQISRFFILSVKILKFKYKKSLQKLKNRLQLNCKFN